MQKIQRSVCTIALYLLGIITTVLNGSEIQYLHPIPESTRLPMETPIIIRFWDISPSQIENLTSFISVKTEPGEAIAGQIETASDRKTILFYSDALYPQNEKIMVSLRPILKGQDVVFCDTTYHFTTIAQSAIVTDQTQNRLGSYINNPEPSPTPKPMSGTFQDPVILNGVSIPSDWPRISITILNNPSDGYLFISNLEGQPFTMILDNTGAPIWYMRTINDCLFSEVQPNGFMSMLMLSGGGVSRGIGINTSYEIITTHEANQSDGYVTNHHELILLPNGNYFVIAHRETYVDMSQYVTGGQTNAVVKETIFQELTGYRQIVMEWRAWDHFDIRDNNFPEDPLTGNYIRFPHMNAIDLDSDGNILLSTRHLSEITKINRYTGDIIWRLGGNKNEFTFIGDPANGFKNQHDIQSLGGGHYTLFDNGNLRSPPYSRAVEYALDEGVKTATLVWQFRDSPDKYSHYMGSVQRLSSGNTVICWAKSGLPKITEVTPGGVKTFEMDFSHSYSAYRAYRFPWSGIASTPYLIAESKGDYVTLIFNKFGDSNVGWYNVYGGLEPHPAQLLTTSTEPFAHLKSELSISGTYYFRVKAVLNNGTETGFSNEVSTYIHLVEPGENMIVNGDFSNGFYFWNWYVFGGAQADHEVTPEGIFHFNITNGGSLNWYVSSAQENLRILQGKTYEFEFDAWATQGRIFEAEVRKSIAPYTSFSQIGLIWITPQPTHYSYRFIMTEPDESYGQAIFNAGTSSHDVYIDNISLKQVIDDLTPDADFEATPVNGFNPLEVQLTDLSTGSITSWMWEFGDGETSVDQHPFHVYEIADTFSVNLTVTGPEGSDIMTRDNYITVLEPPPVADFAADTTEGFWPFEVQFSDSSTGMITSWSWDFGDSEESSEQNPKHTYQTADTFDVTLSVTGPGGADTLLWENHILVSDPPPIANFTADTTRGLFPLDVQFSDLSSGPIFVWLWDFGDGNTSILQNPSNTYSTIDSFTVTLTVIGPGGVDVLTRPDYIVSSGFAPTVGFSADTTQGAVPLEVRFTDESIGIVDTWAWEFGDGETSSIQHPVHSYVTVDTFTVRLIVLGQSGADTIVRPDYLIVTDPTPVADFTADTTAGFLPLDVK
ncbi:aryl-sulfate sulfotransferase, partial [candidate division KSB1 bacterium]|nr:aryl-sulfate sulfotransferase [candidate division KSB1 bacterium]